MPSAASRTGRAPRTSPVAEAAKFYAWVIPVITFLQSLGFDVVPDSGGKLKAEDLDFVQVMVSTWPLALALVTITLLIAREKQLVGPGRAFEDERWFGVTLAGILALAGFVGCGAILEGLAAPEGFYEMPANPLALPFYLAALALGAFAIFYGPVLFFVSGIFSVWAGLWINGQLEKRGVWPDEQHPMA